ncbi:MAG: DUF559 domain-containing protein [Caulobacteraceae bacterium]|nr:DUF559 domain-containing protein [Caulobacteraceae bacterium]
MKPSDRTDRARHLRQEQTEAERKLWSIVRGRKLSGYKFRRQVPIDRYIADFVCLDARLVVELDGGHHSEQADYDAGRTEVLEACGFRVIRFWNREILNRQSVVGDTILRELLTSR